MRPPQGSLCCGCAAYMKRQLTGVTRGRLALEGREHLVEGLRFILWQRKKVRLCRTEGGEEPRATQPATGCHHHGVLVWRCVSETRDEKHSSFVLGLCLLGIPARIPFLRRTELCKVFGTPRSCCTNNSARSNYVPAEIPVNNQPRQPHVIGKKLQGDSPSYHAASSPESSQL